MQRTHRFCSFCGAPALPRDDAAAPAGDSAENRQLTIVFVDIVGSTALAERLGDELFRELVRQYRGRAAQACQKYGGVVARYFGDGLLVYFGYPRAQEADARRAVQASLELQAGVAELSREWEAAEGVRIALRIAVHTGRVVAGDIGSGGAVERLAVIGSAPNVAARIQEAGEPGAVTISGATHRLVHRAFACTALGAHALRGVGEPLELFRVDGPARAAALFDVHAAAAPMVGRDRELAALRGAWARVQAGGAEVVLVEAGPGLGKSRLVAELVAGTDRRVCRQVLLQCSPMFGDTALYPVREYIRATFGLDHTLAPEEWLARLADGFADRELDPAEYTALLAPVLGLRPPAGGRPAPGASPQEERERLHRRLVEWLLREAAGRPVLLVAEDLHWADPSTLDLLAKAVGRLGPLPVLMVLTARPGFSVPWLGAAGATVLRLARLEPADAWRMMDLVAQDRRLPPGAREALQARADGVPLFIEELTRAVAEAEAEADEADGAAPRPSPPHGGDRRSAIPATLQESLAARIDRAAVNRDLLHLCATLGREFDAEVLAAAWDGAEDALRSDLDRLVAADLLAPRPLGGAVRYVFRHALIQEAIYGFQLGAQRRQNHLRVAEVLARRFPTVLESSPEVIAAHHLAAGDEAAALPLLRRAAEIAQRRSAMREAAQHLRRALEITRRQPEGLPRMQQELQLLGSLGVALSASHGFAAPEVGAVFAEAREISRSFGRSAAFFPALHGLYRFYFNGADVRVAKDLSTEMLALARSQRDPSLLLEAHRAIGNCRFMEASFSKASRHFQDALRLYDRAEHQAHRVHYGADPFVVSASMDALCCELMGRTALASRQIDASIAMAQDIDHPYSLCWALAIGCIVFQVAGDAARVEEAARRKLDLAHRREFDLWKGSAGIFLDWHAAVCKGEAAAVARLRDGIARWQQAGSLAYVPYFLSLLAQALRGAGLHAEADGALVEAIEKAEARGELWWLPALRRMRDGGQPAAAGAATRAGSWPGSRSAKPGFGGPAATR